MRKILTIATLAVLAFAEERKPEPLSDGEITLLVEKRRLIEKAAQEEQKAYERLHDAQINYRVAEDEIKKKRLALDCRVTAAFTIDCTPPPPAPAPPKPAPPKPTMVEPKKK